MRHASRPTDPCGNPSDPRRRGGFTLVELLVVIGIIAVLIAIILPSLKKARQSAQKVQCMSNMRQITFACLMFANDHHGNMVNRSASGLYGWDQYGNISASGATKNPLTNSVTDTSSWVAWQRAIDPATGLPSANGDDENITYSAIAQYLGGHQQLTSKSGTLTNGQTVPISSTFAGGVERIFQCPADNILARPAMTGNPCYYRFSYTMNDLVSWNYASKAFGAVNGVTYAKGQRSDFIFTGQVASIRHPQTVEMFLCEDEQTISSPAELPNPWNWNSTTAGYYCDLVASRHDASYRGPLPNAAVNKGSGLDVDCKGNVSFCDGHVDFMGRKDALRQKYTSAPWPDPAPGAVPGW